MQIHTGEKFDVIVAGAGSAGFCAAVQAGRSGLKVALIEKYAMPGGTLTVMGNNSIDQFNNPHRPVGDRMVIAGIGWEYVLALAEQGYAHIPDMDAPYQNHWQYGVRVNPVAAAKVMDDFLLAAGVRLFYDQSIVSVETSPSDGSSHVDAVIVSTKAGLVRMEAKMFIDCTGDGDLCAWAGAPYKQNDPLQPGTLRLYVDGSQSTPEMLSLANRRWQVMLDQGTACKEGFRVAFEQLLGARGDNINHICNLNAADSDRKTVAQIEARHAVVRMMDALKEAGNPVRVEGCAPEVGIRETRRIIGDVVMRGQEYLDKVVYPDAVCYTYWFIDIHKDNEPAEIIYLKDEKTPTISMGAMRPLGLTNVFVAGRCVSADRAANSAQRVKATCMAMGQACGAASVLSIRAGHANTRLTPTEEIRSFLAKEGAIVPGIR